ISLHLTVTCNLSYQLSGYHTYNSWSPLYLLVSLSLSFLLRPSSLSLSSTISSTSAFIMPSKSGVKRASSKKVEEAPSTPPPSSKKAKTSPPPAPKKKKAQKIRLSAETDELEAKEVSKDELASLKAVQANLERPGYDFEVSAVFNQQDQFGRLSFFIDQKTIDDQVEAALEFDKD